ncbi:hypothetical protein D3C80_1741520 [compost metagenome]
MTQVLDDFDGWLLRFGRRYLHLDTGDDDYCGFIVDAERVEEMINLAQRADIEVSLSHF